MALELEFAAEIAEYGEMNEIAQEKLMDSMLKGLKIDPRTLAKMVAKELESDKEQGEK